MSQYTTPNYYRSRSLLGQIAGCSLLLCLSINAAKATDKELQVVLAEQEQHLLHIAEQQRQLQTLNNLLPTLQQLANYPQAAVELLLDNNRLGHLSKADRQGLKQVINALRPQPVAAPLPAQATLPEPKPEPKPVQTLNAMLPALQQLAAYPQAAVELLIDNKHLGHLSIADKQQLKQVITALRSAPVAATLPATTEQSEQAAKPKPVQTLNNMLPALQQLAGYPQAAVELLIDDTPLEHFSVHDKQRLKQVIDALRPPADTSILPPITEAPEPVAKPKLAKAVESEEKPPPQATAPINHGLTPVLALLNDQRQPWSGQVVFQPTDDQPPIVAHLGYAFEYKGGTYQLLDIQYRSIGAIDQFDIHLQTPQGIKIYRLPESL